MTSVGNRGVEEIRRVRTNNLISFIKAPKLTTKQEAAAVCGVR